MEKVKKLNLGCGAKHLEGFVNIDWVEPADLVLNVGKDTFPYPDNSVERIEADNLFEHFDNDEFLHVMKECHRVLKSGGELFFIVPDALHWMDGAFGDPTHKRFFVPRSFYYFTDCPTYHNYGKPYGFPMYKLEKLETDGRFYTCLLKKP